MGANMAERLMRGGHEVVAYDREPAATKRVSEKAASGADSLADGEEISYISYPALGLWSYSERFQ